MLRKFRAVLVLTGAVLFTLPLMPLQMAVLKLRPLTGGRGEGWLPTLFHWSICRLVGLRVTRVGEPLRTGPVLYVVNHVSWLDIPILGSVVKGSFVAKHEVESWPALGLLAKLQRTHFIRRRRQATKGHHDEMQQRLEAGESLILFPEGTSSDGLRLLPFRSSFFALAERHVEGRPLLVQPVTLAFTGIDNMPILRSMMDRVAWIGDTELVPHIWGVLTGGGIQAELRFHQPLTIEDFASRKELAAHCRDVIGDGLNRALTGRGEPAPADGLPLESPVAGEGG